MADRRANELLGRYDSLKSERDSQFKVTWQQIAQYFMPDQSAINTQKLPGVIAGWTDRVWDTTPILAANVLSAGQRNWLTPSNEPFFAYELPDFLRSRDDDSEDQDEAMQWLARATEIAQESLTRSNFFGQVNIDYDIVGTFGTGCLFMEEGRKGGVNFRQFKPWFIAIEENDEGIVDTVFREFQLTTRQAVQQFGLESVGVKISEAYRSKNAKKLSQKWKFLHACFPRDDKERDPKSITGENKPFASLYIAVDDQEIVQESGYDEFPYFVSRFRSWGAETCWGYGPAYLTLPDARQLNYVAQYTDALAELKAYPRFLIPENLDGDVDLRAGGMTTFDPGNGEGALPREWMTVGDDKSALENMEKKKDIINRAFYVNMFQMLDQLADKKMTAYEIAQRLAEKLEQFTPVFDRRVSDFLSPMLMRLFGILYRQGRFGEAPQSLMVPVDGGRSQVLAMPQVAITSRLALALKALHNQGIVNTLAVVQPVAQLRPDVLDNFDLDEMVRSLARNYGVEPKVLRAMRQVNKDRQARIQAQAAQQAQEQLQSLTQSAANMGKAPPDMQQKVMAQFPGTGVAAFPASA